MPFKGNASETQVVQGRKLWTGLANWAIVAVNPTEKEREKLGITQDIKDYVGEDKKENKQTRIDFWLKIKGLPYKSSDLDLEELKGMRLQKLSLFMTDVEIQSNQSDNKLWINEQGLTTWGLSPEDIESKPKVVRWYDTNNLRVAYRGEEQITKFLIALLNVDTRADGTICRLDDPKKVALGNVKEIKDVLKTFPNNTVQCLLGINNTDRGKFQDFYRDFFARTTSKLDTLEAWKTVLKNERSGLGTEMYSDFEIQDLEFSKYRSSTSVGGSEDFSPSASIRSGDSPTPDESDDLPF